ncbi:hypothetical protein HA402_010741 [Bradysia odoriphaga]|nr:hypothetical protein HA402_010741 [Bradysia odoriphaga]
METEELVKQACSQLSKIRPYNLLMNNCEHFATSMKLKIAWSGQVDNAFEITSKVLKNTSRAIPLIIEGLKMGTSVFSMSSNVSTLVLSNLTQAAMCLGPVTVALDITFLVSEYKKKNESAGVCEDTIEELTLIKKKVQDHIEKLRHHQILLTERLRIAMLIEEEVQRIEVARIEEERWRGDIGIKVFGIAIFYAYQFVSSINFW